MKKYFAISMVLVMILSAMCGITTSASTPSADAPIYHFVAGPVDGYDNAMNVAFGQTLFDVEDWGEDYAGIFSLALTVENTDSAASGLAYVRYDAAKVKPKTATTNAMGRFQSWSDAQTGNKAAYATEYSADPINSSILESGVNTADNYVYIVWYGSQGVIDAGEWNSLGYMAELGTFVFETLPGVTVGDFDEDTFVLADDIAEDIGRSPLSIVADGDKVYGITAADKTRLPMYVNFTYPMAEPLPPAPVTYDVVFKVEGETIATITKIVGETLAVEDFPEVEEREGYTFAWDTTEDITGAKTVTGSYTLNLDSATVTLGNKSVSVKAYYTDAVSGEFMIALYSGKEMVGFKKLNSKTNAKTIEETISYSGDVAPDTAKVMVWGNFTSVKPVVAAKIIAVK